MTEGALRGDSVKVPAPEGLPRSRRFLRAFRRDQRGQALVEFALVAIPLFLIVFGIIDFARALNYYNDLTQIAGQGARAAAVNSNPDGTAASGTSIQDALLSGLDTPELQQGTQICIATGQTPVGQQVTTGQPVTVTAKHNFQFIPLVYPVSITLSASETERFEGVTGTFSTGCKSQ